MQCNGTIKGTDRGTRTKKGHTKGTNTKKEEYVS